MSRQRTDLCRTGWLLKRAIVSGRNWKRRYFELDAEAGLLKYRASDTDTRHKGILELGAGCRVDAVLRTGSNTGLKRWCFCVVTPNATLYAAADSAQERDGWVRALRCACQLHYKEGNHAGGSWLSDSAALNPSQGLHAVASTRKRNNGDNASSLRVHSPRKDNTNGNSDRGKAGDGRANAAAPAPADCSYIAELYGAGLCPVRVFYSVEGAPPPRRRRLRCPTSVAVSATPAVPQSLSGVDADHDVGKAHESHAWHAADDEIDSLADMGVWPPLPSVTVGLERSSMSGGLGSVSGSSAQHRLRADAITEAVTFALDRLGERAGRGAGRNSILERADFAPGRNRASRARAGSHQGRAHRGVNTADHVLVPIALRVSLAATDADAVNADTIRAVGSVDGEEWYPNAGQIKACPEARAWGASVGTLLRRCFSADERPFECVEDALSATQAQGRRNDIGLAFISISRWRWLRRQWRRQRRRVLQRADALHNSAQKHKPVDSSRDKSHVSISSTDTTTFMPLPQPMPILLCRMRPMCEHQLHQGCWDWLLCSRADGEVVLGKRSRGAESAAVTDRQCQPTYRFHRVLPPASADTHGGGPQRSAMNCASQAELHAALHPMIRRVTRGPGQSAVIFAVGGRGSGKTHTLFEGGVGGATGRVGQVGLLWRAIEAVDDELSALQQTEVSNRAHAAHTNAVEARRQAHERWKRVAHGTTTALKATPSTASSAVPVVRHELSISLACIRAADDAVIDVLAPVLTSKPYHRDQAKHGKLLNEVRVRSAVQLRRVIQDATARLRDNRSVLVMPSGDTNSSTYAPSNTNPARQSQIAGTARGTGLRVEDAIPFDFGHTVACLHIDHFASAKRTGRSTLALVELAGSTMALCPVTHASDQRTPESHSSVNASASVDPRPYSWQPHRASAGEEGKSLSAFRSLAAMWEPAGGGGTDNIFWPIENSDSKAHAGRMWARLTESVKRSQPEDRSDSNGSVELHAFKMPGVGVEYENHVRRGHRVRSLARAVARAQARQHEHSERQQRRAARAARAQERRACDPVPRSAANPVGGPFISTRGGRDVGGDAFDRFHFPYFQSALTALLAPALRGFRRTQETAGVASNLVEQSSSARYLHRKCVDNNPVTAVAIIFSCSLSPFDAAETRAILDFSARFANSLWLRPRRRGRALESVQGSGYCSEGTDDDLGDDDDAPSVASVPKPRCHEEWERMQQQRIERERQEVQQRERAASEAEAAADGDLEQMLETRAVVLEHFAQHAPELAAIADSLVRHFRGRYAVLQDLVLNDTTGDHFIAAIQGLQDLQTSLDIDGNLPEDKASSEDQAAPVKVDDNLPEDKASSEDQGAPVKVDHNLPEDNASSEDQAAPVKVGDNLSEDNMSSEDQAAEATAGLALLQHMRSHAPQHASQVPLLLSHFAGRYNELHQLLDQDAAGHAIVAAVNAIASPPAALELKVAAGDDEGAHDTGTVGASVLPKHVLERNIHGHNDGEEDARTITTGSEPQTNNAMANTTTAEHDPVAEPKQCESAATPTELAGGNTGLAMALGVASVPHLHAAEHSQKEASTPVGQNTSNCDDDHVPVASASDESSIASMTASEVDAAPAPAEKDAVRLTLWEHLRRHAPDHLKHCDIMLQHFQGRWSDLSSLLQEDVDGSAVRNAIMALTDIVEHHANTDAVLTQDASMLHTAVGSESSEEVNIDKENTPTRTLPNNISAMVEASARKLEQEEHAKADEPGTKELPKTFSARVKENVQTLENNKRTLNEIETIAHDTETENAQNSRMNVRQKLVNHVRCHAPGSECNVDLLIDNFTDRYDELSALIERDSAGIGIVSALNSISDIVHAHGDTETQQEVEQERKKKLKEEPDQDVQEEKCEKEQQSVQNVDSALNQLQAQDENKTHEQEQEKQQREQNQQPPFDTLASEFLAAQNEQSLVISITNMTSLLRSNRWSPWRWPKVRVERMRSVKQQQLDSEAWSPAVERVYADLLSVYDLSAGSKIPSFKDEVLKDEESTGRIASTDDENDRQASICGDKLRGESTKNKDEQPQVSEPEALCDAEARAGLALLDHVRTRAPHMASHAHHFNAVVAHFRGRYDELHELIELDLDGSGITMAIEAIVHQDHEAITRVPGSSDEDENEEQNSTDADEDTDDMDAEYKFNLGSTTAQIRTQPPVNPVVARVAEPTLKRTFSDILQEQVERSRTHSSQSTDSAAKRSPLGQQSSEDAADSQRLTTDNFDSPRNARKSTGDEKALAVLHRAAKEKQVAKEAGSNTKATRITTAAQLTSLACALRDAQLTASRKYRRKTYHDCFVGKDAVTWLVRSNDTLETRAITTRNAAVFYMNQLRKAGLIMHVNEDHDFEDKKLFYIFCDTLQTRNISNYEVGQKVEGLARGDVAGIVISIRPHKVGAMSGPGSIIVKHVAGQANNIAGLSSGGASKAKRTSLKPISSLSRSHITKQHFVPASTPLEEGEEGQDDEHDSAKSASAHTQVDKDAQQAQQALLSHCAAHAPHCQPHMNALLAHFEGRYDELHALIARDTHGSGIAMAAQAIASAMKESVGSGHMQSHSTKHLKNFISAQQRRTPPPTPQTRQ